VHKFVQNALTTAGAFGPAVARYRRKANMQNVKTKGLLLPLCKLKIDFFNSLKTETPNFLSGYI
jgi:hypothetical protein